MGRFETEVLTQPKNLTGLIDLSGQCIDEVHEKKPIQQIIIDIDSSVSETYEDQEGSLYTVTSVEVKAVQYPRRDHDFYGKPT